MHTFGAQLEQTQLLVDKIQHDFVYHLKMNKLDYDRLLTISDQMNYYYGQAFAHIYMAQYFMMMHDDEMYLFHLSKSRDLAEAYNYFDIIVEYDKLEGQRNIYVCNELAALPFFLHGKKTADMTKDRKSAAFFYCSIADLFSGNKAYEDAEGYYIKALEMLDDAGIKYADDLRSHILNRLCHLCCLWERTEKAEHYWEAYGKIERDNEIQILLWKIAGTSLSFLKGKAAEARYEAADFMKLLRQSKSDPILLMPVYVEIIELLLLLKEKDDASWCFHQVEKQYDRLYPNLVLRIQKLRVQYVNVFGFEENSLYEMFYETVQKNESATKASTTQIFSNLISLYETDKQRARMRKERSDLQNAADIDELTRVFNRRYYSKLVSKLIQDDRIHILGYLMIDVDFFKEYNDYYGHPNGDQVLREVASLLKKNLPVSAYATRYGGDEFSYLFPL